MPIAIYSDLKGHSNERTGPVPVPSCPHRQALIRSLKSQLPLESCLFKSDVRHGRVWTSPIESHVRGFVQTRQLRKQSAHDGERERREGETRGRSKHSRTEFCGPTAAAPGGPPAATLYATVGTKLVEGRVASGDTARPDAPRLWPHWECGRALTMDLPSSAVSARTSCELEWKEPDPRDETRRRTRSADKPQPRSG
jgi:hypothetical protein